MKDKLGYIKEEMLNFYNESNINSYDNSSINENNIIDTNDVNNNFEYNGYNQSSQPTQSEEDFDYTLLKIIAFLIFL